MTYTDGCQYIESCLYIHQGITVIRKFRFLAHIFIFRLKNHFLWFIPILLPKNESNNGHNRNFKSFSSYSCPFQQNNSYQRTDIQIYNMFKKKRNLCPFKLYGSLIVDTDSQNLKLNINLKNQSVFENRRTHWLARRDSQRH